MIKRLLKIPAYFLIGTAALLLTAFLVCLIGRGINLITPSKGINETRYVDINGSKQWISIYGKDTSNPVLLYIHGGPFLATSSLDMPMMHKLGEDFTVINWDQRGCGHNCDEYPCTEAYTRDMVIKDGKEMTEYLRRAFNVDKIFLFGSSWGSVLGANLVLEYPVYYHALLATSPIVDLYEHQKAFKDVMLEKYKDDPDTLKLLNAFDPYGKQNEQVKVSAKLDKICVPDENYLTGSEYNMITGILFNPYASIDQIGLLTFNSEKFDKLSGVAVPDIYELISSMSLKDRTDYKVPVYYLAGKADLRIISCYVAIEDYYERISAPDKDLRYVEGGHVAASTASETISDYLREIKAKCC